MQVVRFVVSGGLTALVNLIVLFVLTDLAGIWYLASSVIAFIVAVVVNFFLQKVWTFRDTERARMGKKAALFLLVSLGHLTLNTVSMYVLVDILSVWYLAAQCIVMLVLALVTYRLYKHTIFAQSSARATEGTVNQSSV
jgi:dolichol-phosphate mannosyltransferase